MYSVKFEAIQLSRRFAETIKGNQELREVVSKIENGYLLDVAA